MRFRLMLFWPPQAAESALAISDVAALDATGIAKETSSFRDPNDS